MNKIWIRRSVGPVLLAVALVLGPGNPAGAATPSGVGPAADPQTHWGWVNHVTDSLAAYTPAAINRGNSAGRKNTVFNYATGLYKVTYKGLGTSGGHVQVSTISPVNAFCIAGEWFRDVTNEVSYVECYDDSGTHVNAHFTASYLFTNEGTRRAGYLWADNPSDDYDVTSGADSLYSYNSAHQVNHVTRTGLGAYTVTFPGLGVNRGDVQVTAFLGGNFTSAGPALSVSIPADCKVQDWGANAGNESVRVRCFGGNGLPADAKFLVSFMERQGLKGPAAGRVAYVFAGRSSAASYTPSAAYSYSKPAGSAHVTRQATGRYTVKLNAMGAGGTVKVTAYGTTPVRCLVAAIRTSGTPQRVRVRCYSYGGDPADSKFTLAYQA